MASLVLCAGFLSAEDQGERGLGGNGWVYGRGGFFLNILVKNGVNLNGGLNAVFSKPLTCSNRCGSSLSLIGTY